MQAKIFTDQLNEQVKIRLPVQRIVSLVPSQTELLSDLGLNDRVVGITKFCVHPETWRKTKTIVGGTKKFNFSVIDRLRPDLIIGNKEENYLEGIETLRLWYPVWMSDISKLDDALDMIHSIGEITESAARAELILKNIGEAFSALVPFPPHRVLYLIWKNPWMAAGKDTFIDAMLQKIGWINAVKESRYPELSTDQIKALSPELILLPSEPFPFKEEDRKEILATVPTAKAVLVDGEMFSWYGSRLTKAPAYFRSLGF